jgi:lipopolysaccharide cholinephosphotransferase
MNNENLNKAKKIMFEILKEFDRICKKYNLTYWLDFGTLLGAYRHKGFIPWDDDLDVGMLKEDYEKFLEIAKKELDSRYFLQTKETDKYYLNFFAKIRDRNSTFIDAWEKDKNIKYHQGIYIDIFPAMRVTKSTLENKYFRMLVFLSKLTHNRKIRIDFLTKPLIKKINSFSDKKGEYLISSAETMHYLKPVKVDNIFPLRMLEFEGELFPAPKDTDVYLRAIFGDDFMILPPKEKRVSHSVAIYPDKKCNMEKNRNG